MISFTLDDGVIESYPDAQIRFVATFGLRNDEDWPEVAEEHRKLAERISDGSWHPFTEEDVQISSWHDAYRRFGTNPRRFRPSLDALSRRLGKSGRLPRINGAVDAYNLVSVTCGAPAGAFDVDKLEPQVAVRFSRGGDRFTPLGEPEKVEEPRPGEVVYAQGGQVLTRHWNYRDADLTKVTEDTRNAVFMLERVSANAVSDSSMEAAQESLAALLRPHAAELALAVLDAETPVVKIGQAQSRSGIS